MHLHDYFYTERAVKYLQNCEAQRQTEDSKVVCLKVQWQSNVWGEDSDAGILFPYLKWAVAVPEATHWLCGFLGNDHPQECQACPSVFGGTLPHCFQVSASLVVRAKDFCLSTILCFLNNTKFMARSSIISCLDVQTTIGHSIIPFQCSKSSSKTLFIQKKKLKSHLKGSL